jgi:hypothetical protein
MGTLRRFPRSCTAVAVIFFLCGAADLCGLERETCTLLDDGRAILRVGDVEIEINDAWKACVGCHDGTIARTLGIWNRDPEAGVLRAHHMILAQFHPVHAPYPDGQPGFYRIEELDPNIQLVNGRVTCRTCHPGDRRVRTLGNVDLRVRIPCLSCHDR